MAGAASAGDRQAFARIYERYRVRIYSFLLRLCGRRDQADDLLQDTFVQLARHAPRLRAGRSSALAVHRGA